MLDKHDLADVLALRHEPKRSCGTFEGEVLHWQGPDFTLLEHCHDLGEQSRRSFWIGVALDRKIDGVVASARTLGREALRRPEVAFADLEESTLWRQCCNAGRDKVTRQ